MQATKSPRTLEEAVFDMHSRMVRMETVLIGISGTSDDGLVGKVAAGSQDRKKMWTKLNRIEVKFWVLVGLLVGSGILTGVALFERT